MKSKFERKQEINLQQWDLMHKIRDLEQMGGLNFTQEMLDSGKSVREFLKPLKQRELELTQMKRDIDMEGKQTDLFKDMHDV